MLDRVKELLPQQRIESGAYAPELALLAIVSPEAVCAGRLLEAHDRQASARD